MLYFVIDTPELSLAVLVSSFCVFRFLTSRLMLSEFEPIGCMNATAAFSLSTLTSFYDLRMIGEEEYYNLIGLYGCFYLGIYIIGLLLGKELEQRIKRGFSRRLFTQDEGYRNGSIQQSIMITGLAFFLISLYFSLQMISDESMGDDRTAMARTSRILDTFRQGCGALFMYFGLGLFTVSRSALMMLMIALTVVIGLFSGSKAFLLSYLIAYFTIMGLIEGRKGVLWHLKKWPYLCFGMLGAILSVMFWGRESLNEATLAVLNRLFASGDLYYYALVIGDYTKLFGEYDFFGYLLHPFTALLGVRGYEWPIGARLFPTTDGEILGFGPNPQIPILALVLLNGNYWLAATFAFCAGMLVCGCRVIALSVLDKPNVPLVWRMALFATMFAASPMMLVDIGAFQMNLIAVGAVALPVGVLNELLSVLARGGSTFLPSRQRANQQSF